MADNKFETSAEAWAYTRENEDSTSPKCAGRQFEAAQEIERLHQKHESGDTAAVIYALANCAHHGLVMPDWLADIIWSGSVRWHNFECRKLEDAFGVSRKSKRKPDELLYRKHNTAVFMRILDLIEDGCSIDETMFEQVASAMNAGFSGPTCRTWFYRYVREFPGAQDWLDYTKDPENSPARRKLKP